jgi:four helix bundle protein
MLWHMCFLQFEILISIFEEKQMAYLNEVATELAIGILKLSNELIQKKEYVLSKQIARSGTSIGANLAEAQGAISQKDFLNKQYISFKECKETLYWLHLIKKMNYVTEGKITQLENKCRHVHYMLNKSILTIKSKLE